MHLMRENIVVRYLGEITKQKYVHRVVLWKRLRISTVAVGR